MFTPLVKFKLLRPGAVLPSRGTDGSGAFDLYAPEDILLQTGEKRLIPTGVAHDLPGTLFMKLFEIRQVKNVLGGGEEEYLPAVPAYATPFRLQAVLFDRSGTGSKGVRISFASLIDNDYRGEILLSIENVSVAPKHWKQGNRLAQIAYVLMYAGPCAETQFLTETNRGGGGFGSTGK